jgi:dienelactone hydrolase
MLRSLMHRWEIKLSKADTNRKTLPFEWGLEFLNHGSYQSTEPLAELLRFNDDYIQRSDEFFDPGNTPQFQVSRNRLIFPSSIQSPYPENNTASCTIFYPEKPNGAAVVVVPQWNASGDSHVALCEMISRFGFTTLRLTLPYHEERNPMKPRADYFVSPNLGRTIQAMQQSVHDVRRAADWLQQQGFKRLGIMGSSIGSCICFLAFLHDERFHTGVFNHVSSFFGKVVWNGISTKHVRSGLEPHINEDQLHDLWAILSPNVHVGRKRISNPGKRLFISALYDLTFPRNLAELLFQEHDKHNVPYDTASLPCGHYSSALAPFKYLDGYLITNYFRRNL